MKAVKSFIICLMILTLPCALLGEEISLTLEDAISMALSNNHNIKSLEKLITAQKKVKRARFSEFLPKFTTTYTYTHLKDKPIAIFQYTMPGRGEVPIQTPIGERDKYEWEVMLTQPIFTGFALYSRYKLASLGVDEKKLNKEIAELDLVRAVKVTYYGILYAEDILKSADEEVRHLSSHKRDAENLYREGIIPYNDLLKSKVALASSIQKREEKRADLEYRISRLATLLGLSVNTTIKLLTKVKDNIPPPPERIEPLIEEALSKRPEIREVRLKLRMSDYSIKLARSDYFPKAYLVSGYKHSGYNDWRGIKNKFGRSREKYIGIQIKWDFFEWGKTRSLVKSELLKKASLMEALKNLEDQVALEVKKAYLDLRVAWKNIETAREALSQAKENYRITDLQYKNGLTTSTEVLDARSYLTEAEANYYGAIYGYMIALSNLERSIGRKK